MRSRYFFLTIIFTAVFLALLASCSTSPNIAAQIDTLPDVRGTQVEHVAVQVDAGTLVSATIEPVAFQATPMPDGQAVINSHCAGCHAAAWDNQIKKSHDEWEKVLERMEVMGVHLSDTEKAVLLNYLAVADTP